MIVSSSNKIIKNTLFLYIKMGITVFISLYSTRLILQSLGEIDFGIFNVVGGAISMLGFLNSTLAYATQRYMSYSQGEGDIVNQCKIFNVSVVLHIVIAIITAILLASITEILFESILNIPDNRINASKIIYYGLIFSTVLTIVNAPYDAVMNAHENMLYYSIIGILESFLRLAIAVCCIHTQYDKLITFGLLSALVPLVTLTIMKIYCHRHYAECKISLRKYFDHKLLKDISAFSGWNFLTAVSSLFSVQGSNIVLNHFFGSKLNASQAIATQLNGQLSAFSANLMKALNPVIVKDAGGNNLDQMNRIILMGCKYNTLLIVFLAIPAIIEMPYILQLWIKEVPEWSVLFCRMILIQTIILKMSDSISTAVYAMGNIKSFTIVKSIVNIFPLFFTFITFYYGGEPYWLYIFLILFWAIGGNIVIVYFATIQCSFSFQQYNRQVMIPLFIIMSVATVFGYIGHISMTESILRIIMVFIFTSIGLLFSLWKIGLSSVEKSFIKEQIHSLMNKYRHK